MRRLCCRACRRSGGNGRTTPEVAERELYATEVGMLVVVEGEGEVENVAGEQRRIHYALGHAPADNVLHALEASAVGVGIGRDGAQLQVLLLHDAGRLEQLHTAHDKRRALVPYPERLQLLERHPEVMLDLVKPDLGVVLQLRDEVFGREALP